MSSAQQRWLVLWGVVLSTVISLVFLPVSRRVSLLLLIIPGVIAIFCYFASRRTEQQAIRRVTLPEAAYSQSVVLSCGDIPQQSPVLTITQGSRVRVEETQDLQQVARQLLQQYPDRGRRLSVMISICPQKHTDSEILTSRLLTLRWQISQLRKETGYQVPLVLNIYAGSALIKDMLWQVAVPGEGVSVWRESAAPCPLALWVSGGGQSAMEQQVLMNSLMSWFYQHVSGVFTDNNPDIPVTPPAAVLWGAGPGLAGNLSSSLWTAWLSRCTAMQRVTGWQPVAEESTELLPLPDFVLPLLPEERGLTPRGRAWRCALTMFTLAAIVALLSSGWNNRQLLQRISFDIARYQSIPMNDYVPKAGAVSALREDAVQLDKLARNGVPARMSLGLYQGGRLRMPVLDAIRSYMPPPPPPEPTPAPAPVAKIIRLNSLSLFDSGKSVLKAGSTRLLINSLDGIKARPGWLIVVAGHTDNTGNPLLNQKLSRERAEAVRDWMRDTGDVPESCFAVQGYGENRPAATNNTPEGRAINRRVEISLIPRSDACQMPGRDPSALQGDDNG